MLLSTVADQQIVAGTVATLSWQGVNSDGEPADPGTVTVAVTRSDGTAIAAGTVTAAGSIRSTLLPLSAALTPDWLTARWSVAGTVVATTVAEVVGSVLLTYADFQRREPQMSTIGAPAFLPARREVDDLFLRVTHRSFVPRFDVEQLPSPGSTELVVQFPDVRSVRWARRIAVDGSSEAIDVTNIQPAPDGVIRLSSWWGSWGSGSGTVLIGYEHGMSRPPDDVRGAAAKAIRYNLASGPSIIPARATVFTDAAGGTTQLATPGLGPFVTGIPEVDEVLVGYRFDRISVA